MADTVRFGIDVARVVKRAGEPHRVYGWASLATTKAGKPVVDLQGDVIDISDLETAAAEFVKEYRQGGEMHRGAAPNRLMASVVFTPEVLAALEIPDGLLPQGWLVGFEVDEEQFSKVAAGERLMFSIEGTADVEEIDA